MRLDHLLGFMIEALAIVVLAKLARDVVMKWRGQKVNEMVVVKRSVGAATTQAGYLVGVLLGFLGAVSGRAEGAGFLATAAWVAVVGAVAIVLQLAADLASDKLIFRGLETGGKAVDDVNVALAVGKAAVSVATGLVLRGALLDPGSSFAGRLAWFAVAQAVMVVAVLLYCRLTPYDDLAEIGRNNLAAGFPIAGIILASGFVIEAAVSGKATATATALTAALEVGKFLGISLVLVYLFRLVTDFVMLPKVKLSKAIVEDRNTAAGIQEGVSFLLAALVVTFFLT